MICQIIKFICYINSELSRFEVEVLIFLIADFASS